MVDAMREVLIDRVQIRMNAPCLVRALKIWRPGFSA
jgi:hypothetical protein